MKKLILLFTVVIFSSLVHAATITYQDNTHLYNLRCCNTTGHCYDLKDYEYINTTKGEYIKFNHLTINNLAYCFETNNKLDVNITDAVLGHPEELVVLIFVFLITGIILFQVVKWVKGKK